MTSIASIRPPQWKFSCRESPTRLEPINGQGPSQVIGPENAFHDIATCAADRMKVHFCGVRGSTPAPGPEFARYGGNTPAYPSPAIRIAGRAR